MVQRLLISIEVPLILVKNLRLDSYSTKVIKNGLKGKERVKYHSSVYWYLLRRYDRRRDLNVGKD